MFTLISFQQLLKDEKRKKRFCLVSDYLLASRLLLLVGAVEVAVVVVVAVGVLAGVVVAGADC